MCVCLYVCILSVYVMHCTHECACVRVRRGQNILFVFADNAACFEYGSNTLNIS